MRIAVYENLPSGGALRTSYELGRALIKRGHQIDLYRLSTYADKGSFDLAPEATSVTVFPYRPLFGVLDSRLASGHFAPRSYTLFGPLSRVHQRLASVITSKDYDAILIHPDAMTGAPRLLQWLDAAPTVYYCQEPPRTTTELAVLNQHKGKLAGTGGIAGSLRVLEDNLILNRLGAADRLSAGHARVIAVNSVYSRERVWAAYARNAVVCYLGIDPELFAPANAALERRREVLSFGAPMAAKGHDLTIDALATLPAGARPVFRVVLPQTADASVIQEHARNRKVALIVDKGLSEPDVVNRYQTALLTVCTGRLEPFGLTAIESMACATPVVALREGGYRESVTDGVTGILVDTNAESVAAGIQRLMGNAGMAAEMGAAGRADVLERWTWQRTAQQMEAILKDAAQS